MEKKKLGEIAEVFSGVRVSRFEEKNTKSQPVFKTKFLNTSSILDFEFKEISENLDLKYFSKKDDILFSLSNRNISKVKQKGVIIPLSFSIIRVNEAYDSSFIYHLLKSNFFSRELYKLSEGMALKIVKIKDLKKVELEVPDLEIQKKYGKLLDLMDEKIELKKQSIELDGELKKCVLNNLFDI